MKLIKFITSQGEFFFGKDKIEFKNNLKVKTRKNVSSYLINDFYVVISSDKIVFECNCGKLETTTWSNFKNRKHDLCTSCIRKKTVQEVHNKMPKDKRQELNKKISETTKQAMNSLSPEKWQEMKQNLVKSVNLQENVKKMHKKNAMKTLQEKQEIRNKISKTLKNKYQLNGPWNLKNTTIALLNQAIPENKWFTRGQHSSNEIIEVECDDCHNLFKSKRANLAKQEVKHSGKIYCKKCKLNGERNPGYIDGRKYDSDNSYTLKFFDNVFRKNILIKQNSICPICCQELESGAHLHHIDYNRQNDNENNLIFLHPQCHMKTNFNRDFWQVFFNNYNKNYYEPLYIPEQFIELYFQQFPLINHKFPESLIIEKLKHRKNFNPLEPPKTTGHNISKMLNKKYFYSRKRKNNSSIIDILTSDKIKEIYKYEDSLSNVVNKITSQLYSFPVSLFSHHIMDWILQKWSKENDVIYDPAGGFGGRLIGTYYHKIQYITTDPWTYDELEKINNLLNLNAIIYNKKSEDLKIKCDMVICCPPYYNDENYEMIEQRDYQTWLQEYWLTTINNILADKFVLIIGEKYPEMVNIILTKWKEKERFIIENKSFNSVNKEYIIYFEK